MQKMRAQELRIDLTLTLKKSEIVVVAKYWHRKVSWLEKPSDLAQVGCAHAAAMADPMEVVIFCSPVPERLACEAVRFETPRPP